MYGCELDDDGSKRGYYQFGYDGEDFLTLDKSTLTWTASNPQATITKVKWDSTGAYANSENNYLDNICTEWLNKYVDYGKDTLNRKGKNWWSESHFDIHCINTYFTCCWASLDCLYFTSNLSRVPENSYYRIK